MCVGGQGAIIAGIAITTIISWIPGHAASYLGPSSGILGESLLNHLHHVIDHPREMKRSRHSPSVFFTAAYYASGQSAQPGAEGVMQQVACCDVYRWHRWRWRVQVGVFQERCGCAQHQTDWRRSQVWQSCIHAKKALCFSYCICGCDKLAEGSLED